LHDSGKNILLLSGHYANWESMTILPKYTVAPVGAVYSPLENGLFDLLMMQVRTRFGAIMYPMNKIAKHILSKKDAGTVFLFVADQSPDRNSKCRTTFLHQPALLCTGAEKLASVTQSAVVYLHARRVGRGAYVYTIVTITENGKDEPEGAITKKFAELLEANIREEPAIWLWSHKRWKHKLEG
jgi:KDO2-lipid IV(A) lauroyltransferase